MLAKDCSDIHCPRCGSILEIHDPPQPSKINWESEGNLLEESIKLSEICSKIKRNDCTCPKGCFQKDFPLYLHHPFRGIDSEAGDSWSLSWVK